MSSRDNEHSPPAGGDRHRGAAGLPELEDLPEVSGRNVLVRCDFNVPMAGGQIADDQRIRAALPTLCWLVDRGAQVTACTHFGRPRGQPDPAFDVGPVRARLAELAPGVVLLDNLRFDPGEEADDPAFIDRLVAGQDFYVDDAFGCAHRAHASVVGPPRRLPSAAGRLVAHEVSVLSAMRDHPRRPFVAILGGAKVADKLGTIAALVERADRILVGGGMCSTFLAAARYATGDSLVDDEHIDLCRRLLDSGRILMPVDLMLERTDNSGALTRANRGVTVGWRAVDIGCRTVHGYADVIESAGTILWNGPMGVFEDPRFVAGTRAVGQAVASSSAFTVVGGGDTAAAVTKFGFARAIDHISTGGGAMLKFVEHGDLPGLQALRESAATFGLLEGPKVMNLSRSSL